MLENMGNGAEGGGGTGFFSGEMSVQPFSERSFTRISITFTHVSYLPECVESVSWPLMRKVFRKPSCADEMPRFSLPQRRLSSRDVGDGDEHIMTLDQLGNYMTSFACLINHLLM